MITISRSVRSHERVALFLTLLLGLAGMEYVRSLAVAAPQGEAEVSPEAKPEIRQMQPDHAAAGDEVTVGIEGQNFSQGAYVSFSNPAIRVVSTRRISATKLETRLTIGRKAQPGSVSLYVSNPAGSVAEASFTIAGGTAPPGEPVAPTTTAHTSEAGTPEVAKVDPERVTRGSQVPVKITGKNFVQGAKVSFSNPDILVSDTKVLSSTALVVRIQVAADASTGKAGLFVVNPDEREVEVAFEVTEGTPVTVAPEKPSSTTQNPPPTHTSAGGSSAALHFEVLNLGEATSILQNPDNAKGQLSLASGKLKYEEGGQEVFSVLAGDIKEIAANTILGVNTGTFHVILNSGKSFNFMAASLRPADGQSIVDSLRRALH